MKILDTLSSTKRGERSVASANPLELDPYSPILPTDASEQKDAEPLALAPYSPILRTRTPSDRSGFVA
jgi:hypothetical protein